MLGADLDELCYVPLTRTPGRSYLASQRLAWALRWRAADMARFVRGPSSNGARAAPSLVQESKWCQLHPACWEYLTLTKHDTGEARETSTLTIFVDEGRLKAVLRDRDAHQALFATAATMEALLEALENMLADPLAEWRADRKPFTRR